MYTEEFGSFKELEKLTLKATCNMELNGHKIEPGEVIAQFDKIYASGLSELQDYVTANGGFDNRAHVYWETTKGLHLKFSQGIFSQTQFALMNNAKLIHKADNEPFLISEIEEIETDENGVAALKFKPYDQTFVYDKETGEKLSYTLNEENITISTPYKEIIVSYRYDFDGDVNCYQIGRKLLNGFVELEGRTRIKEDSSGRVCTGIIKIPKLKLMSGLSIRLGAEVNPVTGSFSAEGVPVGERGNSYVIEFSYLDEEI